jgi:multisubunit Na+/H+ antiporter MnhB subunit
MEKSSLQKFFLAYLYGAASVSVFYLGFSEIPRETSLQVTFFLYWLVVGILFGFASASTLLNWPRKKTFQRVAAGSLIPIVLLIAGVKLYFR